MEHNTNNNEQSPGFSIYQFKKWLDEQSDNSLPTLNLNKPKTDIDRTLGSPVYPKVSDAKILERMEDIDGDKEVLLSEFKTKATVLRSYGKRVTILTESGTFSIPRFCVKIEKKK
tara:strand:- start:17397 stop:17741 length:345 start_codon:yes stop_codon:yes gene_type:complete